MAAALREVVFEPHNQLLWLQTAAIANDVILPLFAAGALRGDRPDQAFYVRCDESVNPPESVALGQLVCEVGVAIAAPAEFLVFRVGRAEGALEVVE
jgi:phage tail sheath protein FI